MHEIFVFWRYICVAKYAKQTASIIPPQIASIQFLILIQFSYWPGPTLKWILYFFLKFFEIYVTWNNFSDTLNTVMSKKMKRENYAVQKFFCWSFWFDVWYGGILTTRKKCSLILWALEPKTLIGTGVSGIKK